MLKQENFSQQNKTFQNSLIFFYSKAVHFKTLINMNIYILVIFLDLFFFFYDQLIMFFRACFFHYCPDLLLPLPLFCHHRRHAKVSKTAQKLLIFAWLWLKTRNQVLYGPLREHGKIGLLNGNHQVLSWNDTQKIEGLGIVLLFLFSEKEKVPWFETSWQCKRRTCWVSSAYLMRH